MTEASETTEKPAPPKITIRFLYNVVKDLPATRAFYSDVLGMAEAHFMDEEQWGWAVYQCDGFQLMFFRDDEGGERPFHEPWDFMPGDGDQRYQGTQTSFSLYYPWEDFRAAVARIAAADGVQRMTERPTWRQSSYFGWSIKDPEGRTLEVYSDPPEQPGDGDPEPTWED